MVSFCGTKRSIAFFPRRLNIQFLKRKMGDWKGAFLSIVIMCVSFKMF
jgi:hypothetical protein